MKLVLLQVVLALAAVHSTAKGLSPLQKALVASDAHASSGLEEFTSPNGKYAIEFRTISIGKGKESDGGPDEYASPSLMALRPDRVICEVDKSFRDYRNHPANDFECYWSDNATMVGVVYLGRGWSDLVVLEKIKHRWHRLLLPQINSNRYDELLARHFQIQVPHHDTWAILSVSFTRHTIAVQVWDGVDIGNTSGDALINYRYIRRKGRWIIRIDSVDLDKE